MIAFSAPPFRRSVSVLVPALNEVENLRPTTVHLVRALSETCEEFEIIIVDDGSNDGTADEADRIAAEYPNVRVFHNERNFGIGYSYRRGVEEAQCAYMVYIPGDNTWPYTSCRELFLAIGSADIVTSYAINAHERGFVRRLLSPTYTKCLNMVFGHRMHYYNGLNIYPISFLRANPVTTSGFAFQAELLLRALAAGMSYTEIGLAIDERVSGKSKAINWRSFLNVSSTFLCLVWHLRIKPVFHSAQRGN